MGEYVPAQGLMWIRLTPEEKPTWVGGEYHSDPPRSLVHFFSNTNSLEEQATDRLQILRAHARRNLKEHIEELLQSDDALRRELPEQIVERNSVRRLDG